MSIFDPINVTPVLTALAATMIPIACRFAIADMWAYAKPWLARRYGEQAATSFQHRVDVLLDKAIAFGVDQVVDQMNTGGPITVDPKSFVVRAAVQYATDHAQDLATQAGDLEQKVLARYAAHPMVQQRIGITTVPVPANDAGHASLAAAA